MGAPAAEGIDLTVHISKYNRGSLDAHLAHLARWDASNFGNRYKLSHTSLTSRSEISGRFLPAYDHWANPIAQPVPAGER